MSAVLFLFFFIFGTIVGSFLNVVILRYGTKRLSNSLRLFSSGLRPASNRSLCFTCGKLLHWYELVPILSFCLQRGRCRGCVGRISWQYPLVECITGGVFVGVFLHFFGSGVLSSQIFNFQFLIFNQITTGVIFTLILHLVLWSLLIALSVYDVKHKIIPNALVYGACFFALLSFCISYFILHTSSLLDFWSGFLFSAPFALLWLLSKGRAIGLGDAKLIVLFPWLLGLAKGLTALIIGFWIGAGISLGLLFLKAILPHLPKYWCSNFRSSVACLTLKTELPLGPFLVLGLFLVYVFGWDVTGLSLLMQ